MSQSAKTPLGSIVVVFSIRTETARNAAVLEYVTKLAVS